MKYVNWILVPIDFSEDSRIALQTADNQADLWKTGLVLLHVKPSASSPRTRLSIEAGALERWGKYIQRTSLDNVAFLTCNGDAADEILRVAEQYRPRKIIMGHGGDSFQPGSVTQAVGEGFPGVVEAVSQTADDVYTHPSVA